MNHLANRVRGSSIHCYQAEWKWQILLPAPLCLWVCSPRWRSLSLILSPRLDNQIENYCCHMELAVDKDL